MFTAFPNQVERVLGNKVLVVLNLLAHTRQALTDAPGRVHQAVGASGGQVIERDGEGDLVLNVVQAAKALTEGDTKGRGKTTFDEDEEFN